MYALLDKNSLSPEIMIVKKMEPLECLLLVIIINKSKLIIIKKD